jgi:hypothetical protein
LKNLKESKPFVFLSDVLLFGLLQIHQKLIKTENMMNKKISANSVTSNESSKLPKLTNEGKDCIRKSMRY